LVKFLGDKNKDGTFEKAELNDATIAELTKSLTTINEYKEEFPTDLADAVGVLAVHASQGYEHEVVEKGNTEFPDDSLAKIQTVVETAKALEGLLPEKTGKIEKSRDGSPELQKTVDNLNKAVAGIVDKLEKKETSDQLTKITEAVSAVWDRRQAGEERNFGSTDQDYRSGFCSFQAT